MPDRAVERLHRVTDLFSSGRELVLGQADGEPILVWIAKLNTFQRADAQRDAGAARARRIAGLIEDSDEMQALRVQLAGKTREEKIEFILQPKDNQAFLLANDDIRAEPDWRERIEMLERAETLDSDGNPPTDNERDALAAARREFFDAVSAAHKKRMDDFREDYRGVDEADLDTEYLETARSNLGSNAFFEEYRRSEIYYAARDCTAKSLPNGRWDHTACTHLRLLPNKAAVNDLPEELIERIRTAIEALTMAPSDAGNSDAPESSSASSEPPSNAEDSQPSTPVGQ